MSCRAVQAPGTYWDFCPSEAASVLFLVLFLLTTVAHTAQAVLYRKPYCWVVVMSAIWQSLTYIFRTLSIQNPSDFSDYAAWFVLILMAPLWTNAFVYMVFGRMIWYYAEEKRLWKLKATQFGLVFVGLDIIAFLVQITGAAVAATSLQQGNALRYLHIYMAGVGIQLLFILIFTACVLSFYLKARHDAAQPRGLQTLLFAELTALLLIVIRIIFRIIEYSSGLQSTIPLHEAYQYALDSLPMLIALVVFNCVHPGRVMRGAGGDMPSLWSRRRKRPSVQTPARSTRYRV